MLSSAPLHSHSHSTTPSSSEDDEISVRMRIFIIQATNLVSRDLNGYSDPYIKLKVGGLKFSTKVIQKNLNPVWDAAFDFQLEPQSLPEQVDLVFWDKDRISKDDYMGSVHIPLEADSIWAEGRPMHFDDLQNEPRWFPLVSTRKSEKVTGKVQIKFGFIDTRLAPSSTRHDPTAACIDSWSRLVKGRSKLGLGQRLIQGQDNTSIAIADIPLARAESDSAFGMDNLQIEDPTFESLSIQPTTLASNALHGVVFMEIVSAARLPRTPNVARTGFDMDPFVVSSFGNHIFRTRVVRHSLNPVWHGKLLFKVNHGQENFHVKLSVHDWDKMSGNDYVGVATLDVNQLIQSANTTDAYPAPAPTLPPPSTHLSCPDDNLSGQTAVADQDMKEYTLPVEVSPTIKVPSKDVTLTVRAKFVPYNTLRRRFWLGLAKAYNADPQHGQLSKVLIQSMLEGLGSNLSNQTIDSFFTKYGKDPQEGELTFDELLERLESQVKLEQDHPVQAVTKKKWYSRSRPASAKASENDPSDAYNHVVADPHLAPTETLVTEMEEPSEDDFDSQSSDDEYIIRISTCPICNDSSLGSMTETDVITHVAICSGNDGFNLDKLLMGNFVTEANAQRKWITKVVKSLGYGRYVVGKSNANIIVQDRQTGVMLEEKMPTFIRLGIRLLYRSPAQKINVGKILEDMSLKQGLKFDDPRSTRDIEPFIRFHRLEAHMAEVLEPISRFRNFNEFFYRKLKPDARKLSSPGNDHVAVSVADCRMTCFQTITDAQQFWIKGRQFSAARLLGDDVLAQKYTGGSLAIFRLAPQDYHRYHIPVKGILSEPKAIKGEYYTVNPMAIRSRLDVYGENKRVVSTIESKEFGTVSYVAIGAMMVGSIVLTTQGGQAVERMDEHGYFAFGGSTIVLLFEPNSIRFDADLIDSSKRQIEQLVRVGMSVGVSTRSSASK